VRAERSSFGLILSNRGVLFGATTPGELLELSEMAEQSGAFESIWVGDSIIAIPRLEAISLLSAIAARTRRVRLGPACLSSFPLRHPVLLAHQWATLDLISEGRSTLVAYGNVEQCTARITEFIRHGVKLVALRLTSWDQKTQFRRIIDDLLPWLRT
jgi:Luciferase-like monooxygenase